jgi:hypothetical protein
MYLGFADSPRDDLHRLIARAITAEVSKPSTLFK